MSRAQRLAAEALGTFLLTSTVVGSGIMADALTPDDAVALLANTLATASMLVVLIVMFAPISGAHFNPAVSIAFVLLKEMRAGDAALYIAVQCAGGVGGAVFAHAMFDLPLLQSGETSRSGGGIALSETAATFALVLCILVVRRTRPDAVAWAVGLVIAAGYWWTASTSFANPAVTLGRTLTATFTGIRAADAWVFAGMQTAGAPAAVIVMRFLAPSRPSPADERAP